MTLSLHASKQASVFQNICILSKVTNKYLTGFTTPAAQNAALSIKEKLQKYRPQLLGSLPRLAEVLDPRSSNSSLEALKQKPIIRALPVNVYNAPALPDADSAQDDDGFNVFSSASKARLECSESTYDEVDDFFEFTKRRDTSCKDIVLWWGTIGKTRFPNISSLARDTLMIMGSSVS